MVCMVKWWRKSIPIFPNTYDPKKAIYLGEKHVKLIIASQRPHNEGLLLGFEGVTTPSRQVDIETRSYPSPHRKASELPEGEFYFHELLDLEVMDETGNSLGILTEILETGANDVYVVTEFNWTRASAPSHP